MKKIRADDFELNLEGFDKLFQALEEKMCVKVGVIGSKNARNEPQGNAMIGVQHEFGTEDMPRRSFLRDPLTEFLAIYLEEHGLNENEIHKIMETGSFMETLQKIGITAETVIQDAFDSGGFGEWKDSDYTKKKVHQTLVETQQLRNSIGSRVEKDNDT